MFMRNFNQANKEKQPAVKWHLIIAVVIIGLLLSSSLLGGVVLAKDGENNGKKTGKKTKVAVNGDIDGGVANLLIIRMLEDGFKIYDRTPEIFGIIRAEANLILAHGNESAQAWAREILKNLEETFFADIWFNFNEDEEAGITIVTITAGCHTTTFVFPTPDPSDDAAEANYANIIFSLAVTLLATPC